MINEQLAIKLLQAWMAEADLKLQVAGSLGHLREVFNNTKEFLEANNIPIPDMHGRMSKKNENA